MAKKNMLDIMERMKGGTLSSTPDICRLHATLFNVMVGNGMVGNGMVGNGMVGNWVCNEMVGNWVFYRTFTL